MSIKMIAADLDDTLLRSDKTLSEQTKEAISRARAAGAKFILATGRMPAAIARYAAELHLTEPAICYNGALVLGLQSGETVDEMPVPAALAKRICKEAEAMGLHIQAYRGDEYYAQFENEFSRKYSAKLGPQIPLIYTGIPLSEFVDFDTPKLLIVNRAANTHAIISHLQSIFGEQVDCMISQPEYVEIMVKDVDKGKALERLRARYKFAPEEVMAFGDSENDLSMLKVAGTGCAVANAQESILRACDLVVPSNNSDGVADAIFRLLAEGRIG